MRHSFQAKFQHPCQVKTGYEDRGLCPELNSSLLHGDLHTGTRQVSVVDQLDSLMIPCPLRQLLDST